jgi:colanic acid/amylovoran biosynthesis glycosyltransferase
MKMKPTAPPLFIWVEDYPVANAEPFFHKELQVLSTVFSHIVVFSRFSKQRRRDEEVFQRIDGIIFEELSIKSGWYFKLFILLKSFFRGFFYDERLDCKEQNLPFTWFKLKVALQYQLTAECLEKQFIQYSKRNNLNLKEVVLYSYWGDEAAFFLAKLQKRNQLRLACCRVHNKDVYAERHPESYLPFRSYIYLHLNHIFCISHHGLVYLVKHFPKYHNKFMLSRLGVSNCEALDNQAPLLSIKILTLSYIVPIKNLELLLEVLSEWKGLPIEWTHIGYAKNPEYAESLKSKAAMICTLNPNIHIHWYGFVKPDNLQSLIRHINPHVLVNTSWYEGIPVSMMEVFALGIPVIGPDVCGVPELVHHQVNGWVINPNDKNTLHDALLDLSEISDERYQKLKNKARQKQQMFFSQFKNYNEFAACLLLKKTKTHD